MIVVAQDGVRLNVAGYGEGWRHLLLVPDWLSSSLMYEALWEPLAHRGARLAVYDPRGTGRSDRPAAGYGVTRDAEDAALVVEALALRPVWVVGHGYGAHVAVRLAALRPDLVSGVLLMMPAFGLESRRLASWRDAIEDVRRLTDLIASSTMASGTSDRLARQAADMARTTRPAGLAQWEVLGQPLDVTGCTPPVKVLCGEMDDWTSARQARRALEPSARIWRVWPEAGHYALWEDPERAVDLLWTTIDAEPESEPEPEPVPAAPEPSADTPVPSDDLAQEADQPPPTPEPPRSPWGRPVQPPG
jgi:pimeloyl-ACP methyl ester carboxylesterase